MSDRKRAMGGGEQPEEVLERTRFYESPIPMWVFDTATLEFLEVNNAAIQKYGYSRAEFLSMTILDIRPPEDVPALLREELLDHRHDSLNEAWTHRTKRGALVKVDISTRRLVFQGREAELVVAIDHRP
jgi:PAS domain S-box-containing protein